MNKRNLLLLTGLSLFLTNMLAGDNKEGIDLFKAELYEAAKFSLLKQTGQSPFEQAENYYYLGQVYYQLGQEDSASYYYKKSIEVLPSYPLGYVGEGKLELSRRNIKVAEERFKRARDFAKKDPSVHTEIADVYVRQGDYRNAQLAIDGARKINDKYPRIYIEEGNMLMKQAKVGEAAARYENALHYDKNDRIAYFKLAQLYKDVSPDTALDYLNKLIAIDPNFAPAYALTGEIYMEKGMYRRAAEAYEKFTSLPGVPMLYHERNAQSLFFAEQYPRSMERIKYVLSRDPNNVVMKRLEAYNYHRMEESERGFERLSKFIESTPKERHIFQDYTTLGQLAIKVNNTEKAIEAYNMAIELDPERAKKENLYKEIATMAYGANMYADAIKYFEKYFATGVTPDAGDYFAYGQANYFSALHYFSEEYTATAKTPETIAADEVALKEFIRKGDEAYAEAIKLIGPSNRHIAYMGRARINELLDTYDSSKNKKIEGHARPMYEEALTFMLDNNSEGIRNKDILVAYYYLVKYYWALENRASTEEYCRKILAVDPNDDLAKKILDYFKKKK